ncbi:MAG: cytochrome b [Alphaproteobacteria bacterium]|nr:cytochrome b [Alphaproteobacteria bacterium]
MLTNSEKRYGAVAVTLHWLIAIGIIGMLILGKYMADLPRADPSRFELIQLHKSFGITILALSVLRVLWRLVNKVPPLPPQMPAWQRYAANASHFLLYVLILAIPLSGWAMVSASPLGIPTIWFGQFEIPHLPGLQGFADQHAVEGQLRETHELLGNLMIGLLIIHIGAALKHHFWDRDDVLIRMLPFTRVK